MPFGQHFDGERPRNFNDSWPKGLPAGQLVLPEGRQQYHFFFLPLVLLAGQNLVYMLGYILWWSASIDLEASCACNCACAVSADKMVTLLRDGCLVSVPATYCDIPGTPHEDNWSVATLGGGEPVRDKERCLGTVLKFLSGGQFTRVKGDIDGQSQLVGVPNLQLEAEEGALEPPAEGKRVLQWGFWRRKLKLQWFWWCHRKWGREWYREPICQWKQEKGPSQPQRSNATEEVTSRSRSQRWQVTTHGLEWKFVDDVSEDAYKDNRYKPKLCVADPANMSVLDFWLLFFVARALVKSFRKQTQGSEMHPKGRAVQGNWGSLRFDTWCPQAMLGLLGHCEHWWPFSNTSIRCSFRNGQRSLWANTGSSFFWSSRWWYRPVASNKGTHQYLCICPTSAIWSAVLYCLNRFTYTQTFIVSCYQRQRWVVKQAKSAFPRSGYRLWLSAEVPFRLVWTYLLRDKILIPIHLYRDSTGDLRHFDMTVRCDAHYAGTTLISVKPLTTENTENKTTPEISGINHWVTLLVDFLLKPKLLCDKQPLCQSTFQQLLFKTLFCTCFHLLIICRHASVHDFPAGNSNKWLP